MGRVGRWGEAGQTESGVVGKLSLAPRFQWLMFLQFAHAFTLDY